VACTTVPLVFACFAPFRGYSTVFHPGALVVCMDCLTYCPPHSSSSGNSRRACKKQWLIIFCAIGNLHGPVEQLLALNVGERVAPFAGLFRPNCSARFLLSILWRCLVFAVLHRFFVCGRWFRWTMRCGTRRSAVDGLLNCCSVRHFPTLQRSRERIVPIKSIRVEKTAKLLRRDVSASLTENCLACS